jgi:hypothetical protein
VPKLRAMAGILEASGMCRRGGRPSSTTAAWPAGESGMEVASLASELAPGLMIATGKSEARVDGTFTG